MVLILRVLGGGSLSLQEFKTVVGGMLRGIGGQRFRYRGWGQEGRGSFGEHVIFQIARVHPPQNHTGFISKASTLTALQPLTY